MTDKIDSRSPDATSGETPQCTAHWFGWGCVHAPGHAGAHHTPTGFEWTDADPVSSSAPSGEGMPKWVQAQVEHTREVARVLRGAQPPRYMGPEDSLRITGPERALLWLADEIARLTREKDEAEITLPEPISPLGEAAYSGVPTKKWIRERTLYAEGWNDCLKAIRARSSQPTPPEPPRRDS